MTMEVKEVIGVIITVVLASAGVFGILLVLIIDKLSGVIDSLNSISASLHLTFWMGMLFGSIFAESNNIKRRK